MSALLGNEAIALRGPTGITDQSGNGRNGTYVGDATTIADTGEGGETAFVFDGTGDWITMGDVVTPTTDLSGSCWIKTTNRDVSQFVIAQYGDAGQRSYYFAVLNGGKLRVIISGNGTLIWIWDTDDVHITNNVWYHIAFTYSAGTIKIYVDGAEVPSAKSTTASSTHTTAPTSLFNATSPLYFAARSQTGSPTPVVGRCDDFRLWTVALTAGNIATVADSRAITTESCSISSATATYQTVALAGTYVTASAANVQARILYALDVDPTAVRDYATEFDFEVPGAYTNTGLATDGTNFWYADWTNGDIIKMTPAGVLIATLNVATGTERLQGVVYDPTGSGSLWYCRFNDNQVRHIQLDGTEISADTFSVTAANGIGLHTGTDMLYVLRGSQNTSVYKYNKSGVLQETLTIARPSASYNIDHIWIDSTRDHMWVTFSNVDTSLEDRICVYELDGTLIATLDNGEINIEGIVLDGNGKLWTCHDAFFHSSVPNGNRVFRTDVSDLLTLIDRADTVVVDWTTVDSSLSGGTWSGSMTAPVGGPYYAVARSRDSGGTVLATSGQSSEFSATAAPSGLDNTDLWAQLRTVAINAGFVLQRVP